MNTPSTPLSQTTQARLGYCALAAAGAAALPGVAQATILTFNPNLTIPATLSGVYINFLTGATGTSGAAVAGWDFNPYLAGVGTQLGFYWATPQTSSGGVAVAGLYADLTTGTTISAASTFTQTILGTTGSPYLTAGDHILGFRFFNEGTGATNYGYATIRTSAGNGFPARLLSYSFENSGGAITVNVTAVPEPGTAITGILALALGAGAVRNWRRRKV